VALFGLLMANREDPETLLKRVVDNPPPFYRVRFPAKRHPCLADIPLTSRHDVLRDQLEHLPHGTRRLPHAAPPVRAGVTGSGDSLLVLTWSAADLTRERAAGVRLLGSCGIEAGMRVANILPGALATPGALLLGDVIEEIGGLDIPLGAVESDAAARQAWDLIDRVEPAVLVLDPQTAPRLFATAPPQARPWWRGMVWLRVGAAPTPIPPLSDALGFDGWQRTWLAVPEASCFVAHSCTVGHFHVDAALLAEVVDPRAAALPPGRDGMLVLTAAISDAPLLRYATGIAARALSEPCPCGANQYGVEVLE
jgi:hypothetical protein